MDFRGIDTGFSVKEIIFMKNKNKNSISIESSKVSKTRDKVTDYIKSHASANGLGGVFDYVEDDVKSTVGKTLSLLDGLSPLEKVFVGVVGMAVGTRVIQELGKLNNNNNINNIHKETNPNGNN